MTSVAVTLAEWAADLKPGPDDEDLARRSLAELAPTRRSGPGRMFPAYSGGSSGEE